MPRAMKKRGRDSKNGPEKLTQKHTSRSWNVGSVRLNEASLVLNLSVEPMRALPMERATSILDTLGAMPNHDESGKTFV